MLKKKAGLLALALSIVTVSTAVVSINNFAFSKLGSAENQSYGLTLDSSNKPSFLNGTTSSSFVTDTAYYKNNSLPITYTKAYYSSSGNASLAVGGNIMSSMSSSSNLSNMETIKVTFTSGGLWLRYGFNGEDHQMVVESGKTYKVCGNWFMLRNTDAANVENISITVTYPCSDDMVQPINEYFSEGFNNQTYNPKNIAFEELCSTKQLKTSFIDNENINVSMFTSDVRYQTMINTVSKFEGEYSVSIRMKFADAGSERLIFVLGKQNYKTAYNTIVGNHPEAGCAFEINTAGKWVRSTGGDPSNPTQAKQQVVNGCISANPHTDFVTYTLTVDYGSGSVLFYENRVLKATFNNSVTYNTDGYISIHGGSATSCNLIIGGIGVDGPTSGTFDATFDYGSITNSLVYYPRTAGAATMSDSTLDIPYQNGNLATVVPVIYPDVTVRYRNTTDGRISVIFGATDPANKGYRPGGQNITTGLVSVMITPTFARVYKESGSNSVTEYETFGTTDSFIEARIVISGTEIRVMHESKIVIATQIPHLGEGQVVFAAGNNPATVEFDHIKMAAQMTAGLIETATTISLSPNQTKDIDINKSIGSMNYLSMKIQTSTYVRGQFVYRSLDDSSVVVSEDFFVEGDPGEQTFNQFLDAFRPDNNSGTGRPMSSGLFTKFLVKVSFTNVTNSSIQVHVNFLEATDNQIPSYDKMKYIEKDGLKVGMDLATGGTLSYLEKTSCEGYTVDEVTVGSWLSQSMAIGPNKKSGAYKTLSSHVNLINIYDAGRQIQQSYYASVGGANANDSEADRRTTTGNANGYTRRMSYTADKNGFYWPYNPVQGGDEICNVSQIIDFHVTSDELYCKTRALDWAAGTKNVDRNGNHITKSYMENWFKIVDGVLQVKNRFIDWNGFTNMDQIPSHNLEIPATYIAHPLHNYYSYIGDNPFNDSEMASKANLDIQGSLGSWSSGSYKTTKHKENWFAWLNDDADPFGVAVYIPNTGYYASGRSEPSCSASNSANKNASSAPMVQNLLYNKQAASYTNMSCYVRNTSYTAPTLNVKMKEYVPLSYEYVIAVDRLSVFRPLFKTYYQNNLFANTSLNAWN